MDAALAGGDARRDTTGHAGTDAPFPLGEAKVGALVRGCDLLGAQAQSQILDGNARHFFGL